MSEIERLRAERAILRARIAELETQLDFLRTHTTFARGLGGERLVASMLNGHMTSHDASFDVETSGGQRIEVKNSKASPNEAGKSSKRWQWNNVFGENGQKTFDFLLLVGEADGRFMAHYADPDSPFVFFLLKFGDVGKFTRSGGRGMKQLITLGTNPLTSRSKNNILLYSEFQTTRERLDELFGLFSVV